MQTRSFTYEIAGNAHDALLVAGGRRARIIMLPDWEGSATPSARRLAEAYAVTCEAEVILTDLYGRDGKPVSFWDADRVMSSCLSRVGATRRTLLGMVEALEPAWTHAVPLFAVGFCFGGSMAFEMGRSGAPVAGAVSIHGNPQSQAPLDPGGARPSFLMIHGGADPLIPGSAVSAFAAEMTRARVEWSLLTIGHAKHSFTREDIGPGNAAMGYSPQAESMARRMFRGFIDDVAAARAAG